MTAPRPISPKPGSGANVSCGSNPTVSAASVTTVPALDGARFLLAAAAEALDGWVARRINPGHNYVRDGREAVPLLDAATRDLSRVRAVLVGQLRADEDERAARVDHLLADLQAGRDGVSDWLGGHEPTRDGGAE
jgi:hypothetical protein